MFPLLLRVLWAVLMGRTGVKASRHACAYCQGTGTIPGCVPIGSLFPEPCPMCGGSGEAIIFQEVAR